MHTPLAAAAATAATAAKAITVSATGDAIVSPEALLSPRPSTAAAAAGLSATSCSFVGGSSCRSRRARSLREVSYMAALNSPTPDDDGDAPRVPTSTASGVRSDRGVDPPTVAVTPTVQTVMVASSAQIRQPQHLSDGKRHMIVKPNAMVVTYGQAQEGREALDCSGSSGQAAHRWTRSGPTAADTVSPLASPGETSVLGTDRGGGIGISFQFLRPDGQIINKDMETVAVLATSTGLVRSSHPSHSQRKILRCAP